MAADAGAAGGMRTTADSVVPPRGRQLHFDPMHDSSQADLTKDSQGASIQKLFITFLKSVCLIYTRSLNVAGLWEFLREVLFEYIKRVIRCY